VPIRKERTMGVRFNSKKTSTLLAAGMLLSGTIVYANGATSGGETPKVLAFSADRALLEDTETTIPAVTVSTELLVDQLFLDEMSLVDETTAASSEEESVDEQKLQLSAAVIVETPAEEEATSATVVADAGECAQWRDLAIEVGWPAEEWDRLNYVIWRESRCDPSAHNKSDPAGGSRGLIQINGFWCRKNQNTAQGYLQDNGVLQTCEDLFDPRTNLAAGLVIWTYGVDKHGCGWGPWSTRKSKWC